MAMNTYPFVERAAFYIDEEVAAYINLNYYREHNEMSETLKLIVDSGKIKEMARNNTLPDIDLYMFEVVEILWDAGIDNVCYVNDFEGEVYTAFPSKTEHPIEASLSDESFVCLVTDRRIPRNQPDCEEKDALLEEFRSTFKGIGVTLPADFDWWAHIVTVSGTYYC